MKLLIVDDHPVLRAGLSAFLRRGDPSVEILEADDAETAFASIAQHPDLDLVILDLRMPDVDGHAMLREMGRRQSDLPIIVLSASEDPADVRQALALGALGYVPKSASQKLLTAAIEMVLRGEIYLPPLMSNASAPLPNASDLTPRQRDVLRWVREGQSNKQIATDARPVRKDREGAPHGAVQDPGRGQSDASDPLQPRLGSLAVHQSVDPRIKFPSSARKRAGRTGLWTRVRPLARASISRSGAVSPDISTAGSAEPQRSRSRPITAIPFSPALRRRSQITTSGTRPLEVNRSIISSPDPAAMTSAPQDISSAVMPSRIAPSSSITATRPCGSAPIRGRRR